MIGFYVNCVSMSFTVLTALSALWVEVDKRGRWDVHPHTMQRQHVSNLIAGSQHLALYPQFQSLNLWLKSLKLCGASYWLFDDFSSGSFCGAECRFWEQFCDRVPDQKYLLATLDHGKTSKHRANGGGSDSCYFVLWKAWLLPSAHVLKWPIKKVNKHKGTNYLVKTKDSCFNPKRL